MVGVRVLVVEDDVRMAAAIRRGLRFEGLVVDVAPDGARALQALRASAYDGVVLDVMLPGLDGFETCRRLRAEGIWVPVLMLTARDAVEDRVRGLDDGADDYLTKPFSLAELTARLRALARRGGVERPAVLEVGGLRLDPATREVRRDGVAIELSAREFALLETFMRRPGQVLTQDQLLEAAWDHRLRASLQRGRGVRALPAREDRPAVRDRLDRDGAGRRLPAAEGSGAVSRVPLRVRLTAAFAFAMVLVLIGAALFVYLRLKSDLDESVTAALDARAAAVLASGSASAGAPGDPEEGFALLVSPDRPRRSSAPASCAGPRRGDPCWWSGRSPGWKGGRASWPAATETGSRSSASRWTTVTRRWATSWRRSPSAVRWR